MNEWLVITGVSLVATSGLPGLFLDRADERGERIATALVVLGAALGSLGALRALAVPETAEPIRIGWQLVGAFAWALRPNVKRPAIDGAFPATDSFHTDVPDTVLDRLLVPATTRASEQRRRVMWLQRGHLHAYLFFILATLVLLLLWKGG